MSFLDGFIEEDLVNPVPVAVVAPLVRREVRIAIRNDGVQGSGTPEDPYNGSTPGLLDALLANDLKIKSNMTVRLCPGIYRTRGGAGSSHVDIGWTPQSGQKIIGSGMDQTVLQLFSPIYSRDPQTQEVLRQVIPIIGQVLFPIEDLEISDLTLDCNLARLPMADNAYAPVVATGIWLLNERNIRIRRVRVINWGTHTPLFTNGVIQPGNECFPIYIDGNASATEIGELVVENCIVEQPDLSPARENTRHVRGRGVGTPRCGVRNSIYWGHRHPMAEVGAARRPYPQGHSVKSLVLGKSVPPRRPCHTRSAELSQSQKLM